MLVDPHALPRAFVAYGWTGADGFEDALQRTVATPATELGRAPVIEGAGASQSASREPGRVRIVSEEARHVEVEAEAAQAGWLVLADTFYPGWKATVDGDEVDIRPANAAFRAVELPPGGHRISFDYRPASAAVGAWLSLATFLLLLLGAAYLALRRRGRLSQRS